MDYKGFIQFCKEQNAHYKELLEFQKKKVKVIHNNDIAGLEKSLAEEQALVMKSDVLEKKRLSFLENSEFSGKSFPEIIENAPKEYKAELTACHAELKKYVLNIKELNDSMSVTIRERLKRYERAGNISNTYNQNGNVNHYDNSKRTTFNA